MDILRNIYPLNRRRKFVLIYLAAALGLLAHQKIEQLESKGGYFDKYISLKLELKICFSVDYVA